MTGSEYEQFVRAVLCRQLSMSPEELASTHSPGVTLPNAPELQHQIDLFYVQESEIAKYVTIIECKYRGSQFVDQPELQNLAFVKQNSRAHKAIMVTNNGFTRGAKAVAESQEIALLVIEPSVATIPTPQGDDVDELFNAIQAELNRTSDSYNIQVVRKFHSDSEEGVRDLVAGLLADPSVRRQVDNLLRDPEVRNIAHKVATENPDLVRKAMDFLGKNRW